MAIELEVVAALGAVGLVRQAPHVGEADGQRLGVGVGREAGVRAPRGAGVRRLGGRDRALVTGRTAESSLASSVPDGWSLVAVLIGSCVTLLVTLVLSCLLSPGSRRMIAVLVHNRGMYAVIMAGGGGTRLWPLSRTRRPKPFLPLLEGGRCLLEAGVSRLAPLVEPEDVYVVTDARYAEMVREVAPLIPAANIIGEPMGRNTAAAVALVVHAIDRPADDVMVVLPADQAIADEAGFRAALAAAAERAAGGDIVTLGIEPTEPATGYGYILAGGEATEHAGRDTFRVERFEEKPSPERAEQLIA